MFEHSHAVLEEARRTRQRSEQLCRELRQTVARSLVTLWHSRRQREGASTPLNGELASRAECAKRNRETIVRTPSIKSR